jgi:mono/diheme cytochrome c family protein
MFGTNFRVVSVSIVVIGFYTMVAHMIPQLESEVPEALDFSGGVSAETLAHAGEDLFNGAGSCTACHGTGTRAPNLITDHQGEGVIGARCASRKAGVDCKSYLYESLTNPGAYVVAGFDNIMIDMRRQKFSEDQIWAVVAFLESQGGVPTVTAADIERTGGAAEIPAVVAHASAAAPSAPPPVAPAALPAASTVAAKPAPVQSAAPVGATAPPPAAPPPTVTAPELASNTTTEPSAEQAPPKPQGGVDPKLAGLVDAGEKLFNGPGECAVCHDGKEALAPNLLTDSKGQGPIGARCGTRVPGKDCATYLYESLVEPELFITPGFRALMTTVRGKLTEEQIRALVAYLQSLGGTVTPPPGGGQKPSPPPPAGGGAKPSASSGPGVDAVALMKDAACLSCHVVKEDGGTIGPSLDGVGKRLTADQIRKKILDPSQQIAAGFEHLAGTMPATAGKMFSPQELDAVVRYLASSK